MPAAAYLKAGWCAMGTGFEANSGIEVVDSLLPRGGMASMLLTIWLILGALVYGTLLDEFGLLLKLVTPVLMRARSTGLPDRNRGRHGVRAQYRGWGPVRGGGRPARNSRAEFNKRGLAATNLSRAVADGGSVTSPLIPWNSCGAYMAAVLRANTGLPAVLPVQHRQPAGDPAARLQWARSSGWSRWRKRRIQSRPRVFHRWTPSFSMSSQRKLGDPFLSPRRW